MVFSYGCVSFFGARLLYTCGISFSYPLHVLLFNTHDIIALYLSFCWGTQMHIHRRDLFVFGGKCDKLMQRLESTVLLQYNKQYMYRLLCMCKPIHINKRANKMAQHIILRCCSYVNVLHIWEGRGGKGVCTKDAIVMLLKWG